MKKEIIFVTHNKGKIASAQKDIKTAKLKIFEYDLEEPRSDDVSEISKVKVKEAYELVKKPCIAMDSGFFIEELRRLPKGICKFFSRDNWCTRNAEINGRKRK